MFLSTFIIVSLIDSLSFFKLSHIIFKESYELLYVSGDLSILFGLIITNIINIIKQIIPKIQINLFINFY